MNLELGIVPLVDSARSGWIVRHMGAEFHDGKIVICGIDGPNDSSHGRKGSMMIKNGTYGSRGWQIMVELNQAHIKGKISSTMWQCGQLEDCP